MGRLAGFKYREVARTLRAVLREAGIDVSKFLKT
jgi:hypothetical protein